MLPEDVPFPGGLSSPSPWTRPEQGLRRRVCSYAVHAASSASAHFCLEEIIRRGEGGAVNAKGGNPTDAALKQKWPKCRTARGSAARAGASPLKPKSAVEPRLWFRHAWLLKSLLLADPPTRFEFLDSCSFGLGPPAPFFFSFLLSRLCPSRGALLESPLHSRSSLAQCLLFLCFLAFWFRSFLCGTVVWRW